MTSPGFGPLIRALVIVLVVIPVALATLSGGCTPTRYELHRFDAGQVDRPWGTVVLGAYGQPRRVSTFRVRETSPYQLWITTDIDTPPHRRLRITSIRFIDAATGTLAAHLVPTPEYPMAVDLPHTIMLPRIDLPDADFTVHMTLHLIGDRGEQPERLRFHLRQDRRAFWSLPLWEAIRNQ